MKKITKQESMEAITELYDSLPADEKAAAYTVFKGLVSLEEPKHSYLYRFLTWATNYVEEHGTQYAHDLLMVMALAVDGSKAAWDTIETTV